MSFSQQEGSILGFLQEPTTTKEYNEQENTV